MTAVCADEAFVDSFLFNFLIIPLNFEHIFYSLDGFGNFHGPNINTNGNSNSTYLQDGSKAAVTSVAQSDLLL